MKNICKLILLFSTFIVSSQEIKFGKVSEEELKEKFHPIDSTASAAYLYKYRKTFYEHNSNKGFSVITKVHERIKIYNKEGLAYADKLVSYYKPETGDPERVTNIKAYTFNISNKELIKAKLSNKQIFDEKKSKFWSFKKIAMPAVKVGSVIDLKYEIRSPYHTIIDDIEFQFGIPVKKYKTFIETPEYYVFKKNTKGYYFIPIKESFKRGKITFLNKKQGVMNNPNIYTNSSVDYKTIKNTFAANNIPALKDDEPYVGNIKNYRGGISYELSNIQYPNSTPRYYSTTWSDVSKKIYESSNFGGELNKVNYFKKDLTEVLSNTTTEIEKLSAIFQFVKSKVKWNNYIGYYTDKGVKEAYKEGVGNVADINLMLTAMLREAGLNAEPVLVSSKNNGTPLFPSRKGFNYVVSIVEFKDGSYSLLDATEPYSLPNVLPKRALNWKGRKIMKNGNSSWVNLTSSLHSLKESKLYVKITEDKTIEGLHKNIYTKEEALGYRLKNNKLKEENVTSKIEENYNIEIEDYKVANELKLGKPIVETIKFTSEDAIEVINNKLYINPLLYLTATENPFKSDERKYPVDFIYLKKYKNFINITFPKEYEISFVPESLAIGLPNDLGHFKINIKTIGNVINIQSILQFNEAIIGPNHYNELKEFYKQIVAKNLEKIILVKK